MIRQWVIGCGLGGVLLSVVLGGCSPDAPTTSSRTSKASGTPKMSSDQVAKTEDEWRAKLTPEQYRILRDKGTERAFTGAYWKTKTPGVYLCAACGQELYSSEGKFDSGTGWPSFWQAINDQALMTEPDRSLDMDRTELMCSRCGSHLGHVFDDGPAPTGQRHCINSASLKLVESE